MKFPIKTLLVTVVALLLAIPTGAMAKGKPSSAGQGNGGGHGKPSWAGQGHGKADKAKGHGKADKAKAAHEKKAKKEKGNKHEAAAEEEEDESDPDELSLEDLEDLEAIGAPGQYCHALESMQDSLAGMFGGESFDEHFGTNDNLANSFGKCASWRAQGGELSEEEAAEEAPAEDSCAPAEEEATEDEAGEEEGTSEEPTGDEPAEDEEATEAEDEEATEDACESDDPAQEDPAKEEGGEGSDDDESEDESFTVTVTVAVDLSFLRGEKDAPTGSSGINERAASGRLSRFSGAFCGARGGSAGPSADWRFPQKSGIVAVRHAVPRRLALAVGPCVLLLLAVAPPFSHYPCPLTFLPA
jgi:hypothetical protein